MQVTAYSIKLLPDALDQRSQAVRLSMVKGRMKAVCRVDVATLTLTSPLPLTPALTLTLIRTLTILSLSQP